VVYKPKPPASAATLAKRKEDFAKFKSEAIELGKTTYTEANRAYYLANKERINKERSERNRVKRAAARAAQGLDD
jgi:hypothetical protein